MLIDDHSYRKDLAHQLPLDPKKPRPGYDWRPPRARVLSVVVHATHGKRGSAFHKEAEFLRDSMDVSAHYLVGRAGQVALILPEHLMAWHAGVCLTGYGNATSIGIELHAAATEPITAAQRAALAGLVWGAMQRHQVKLARVRTHRAVARPVGRKSDPGTWSESQFAAWRARLGEV